MRSFREHQIYQLSESLEHCDIREGIENQLEILRLRLIESSKLPKLMVENISEQSEWNLAVEEDYRIQRYVIDNSIRFAKENLYEALMQDQENKGVSSLNDLKNLLMQKVDSMFKAIQATTSGGIKNSRGSASSASSGDFEEPSLKGFSKPHGGGSVMGSKTSPEASTEAPTEAPAQAAGGYQPAPLGSFLPAAKTPGESWWSRLKGGLKRGILDPISQWGPIKRFRQRWHDDPNRKMAKEAKLEFNTILLESEMILESVFTDQLASFSDWLDDNLSAFAKKLGLPFGKEASVVGQTNTEKNDMEDIVSPDMEDGNVPVTTTGSAIGSTSTGEEIEDIVDPEQDTEIERRAAEGDPQAKAEVREAYQQFIDGAKVLGMTAKVNAAWGKGKKPKMNRSQLLVNGQPIEGSAGKIGRQIYEKIYTDILGGQVPETKGLSEKVIKTVNKKLGLYGRPGNFPDITAAIMKLGELSHAGKLGGPETSPEPQDVKEPTASKPEIAPSLEQEPVKAKTKLAPEIAPSLEQEPVKAKTKLAPEIAPSLEQEPVKAKTKLAPEIAPDLSDVPVTTDSEVGKEKAKPKKTGGLSGKFAKNLIPPKKSTIASDEVDDDKDGDLDELESWLKSGQNSDVPVNTKDDSEDKSPEPESQPEPIATSTDDENDEFDMGSDEKSSQSPEEFMKNNKRLMVDDGGRKFETYKEKIKNAIKTSRLDRDSKIEAIQRIHDSFSVDDIEAILSDLGVDLAISNKIINSIPLPVEEVSFQQMIGFYKKLLKEGTKPTQSRIRELREKLLNS